ncbi:MAG: phosphoglycolate phosphatase [Cardiobacteriaceae bacterium]|nr:phosphoglycolate phosphatase [Cardiobacteriaceae bacterium]
MNIQAIAFDLDGTLCDTLPDLVSAANASRQHLDLPALPDARIESYVGDGIPRLVHRLLCDNREGEAPAALHEKAYRYFTDYYREHLCVTSRLYPEVATTLEALRAQNLSLAVITNKNEALAHSLLRQLGIADYFRLILGGDSLSEKKPQPLPLLTTAKTLGISPPNMLMVGDSANDILAGKAANCPVAAVTYGYADIKTLQQQEKTQANYLIEHFAQLLQIL